MKTAVLTRNGSSVVETVELAAELKSRMIGLLGRGSLGPQRAMYLAPCNSIHTFFMRFPLDLVFLSREMRVVRIVRGVAPWRMVFGGAGAWSVLEMESGWFDAAGLKVGDEVKFE